MLDWTSHVRNEKERGMGERRLSRTEDPERTCEVPYSLLDARVILINIKKGSEKRELQKTWATCPGEQTWLVVEPASLARAPFLKALPT